MTPGGKITWEEAMLKATISLEEARRKAEQMIHDSGQIVPNVRVAFTLVNIVGCKGRERLQLVPCEWYDPANGLYTIVGVEGKVTRAKETPREWRVVDEMKLVQAGKT